MRELSLNEIQEYSLRVLENIHDFCVNHGIHYSLAYGTLIGAVRHKGFIPWDDDIDVIMTRDNFERFLNEYESTDQFKLISPYNKESYIAFARVCDNKETLVLNRTPWCKCETGIWVDIFPMDAIDDNEESHKKRYKKIHNKWAYLSIPRGGKSNFSRQWGAIGNIKVLLKKIISFNGFHLRNNVEKYLNLINDKSFFESSHCAQLACCDEYGFYEKKDFEKYTTLEFEGHKLCVIKEYDKVLRSLYGDYMQLPPIEDQQPKQADYIKFYKK